MGQGFGRPLEEKQSLGWAGTAASWVQQSQLLGASPSQDERDGVDAASFKTKAKLNKFPD